MPEQRKRLHRVAEITLSTTFLLASEVPAIAAFARSGLRQERASGYFRSDSVSASPFAVSVSLRNRLSTSTRLANSHIA